MKSEPLKYFNTNVQNNKMKQSCKDCPRYSPEKKNASVSFKPWVSSAFFYVKIVYFQYHKIKLKKFFDLQTELRVPTWNKHFMLMLWSSVYKAIKDDNFCLTTPFPWIGDCLQLMSTTESQSDCIKDVNVVWITSFKVIYLALCACQPKLDFDFFLTRPHGFPIFGQIILLLSFTSSLFTVP